MLSKIGGLLQAGAGRLAQRHANGHRLVDQATSGVGGLHKVHFYQCVTVF